MLFWLQRWRKFFMAAARMGSAATGTKPMVAAPPLAAPGRQPPALRAKEPARGCLEDVWVDLVRIMYLPCIDCLSLQQAQL